MARPWMSRSVVRVDEFVSTSPNQALNNNGVNESLLNDRQYKLIHMEEEVLDAQLQLINEDSFKDNTKLNFFPNPSLPYHLYALVEDFVHQFFPEDDRKSRAKVIQQRIKKKNQPKELLPPGILGPEPGNRHVVVDAIFSLILSVILSFLSFFLFFNYIFEFDWIGLDELSGIWKCVKNCLEKKKYGSSSLNVSQWI